MHIFQTISPLILLFIYNGDALEFDAAFANGQFEEIRGSSWVGRLDPQNNPSKSVYFDLKRNKSLLDNSHRSINLTFESQNLNDNDFTVGISLVFLKFTSFPNVPSTATVKTFVDDKEMHSRIINGDFDLPETMFEERHIARSWEIVDTEDFDLLQMRVELTNWHDYNQIYFTATSYKIKRKLSDVSECQGFSFKRKWWNCNTNEENSNLLCLNYDLTCDGLPHCAKTTIPNPDENCGYHVGFQEALQLLVYSLLTIFIVLFVAGCAKCCLRGVCLSRRMGRRPSDILEILTAESSQRPDNSPPTYDDAMKYVNDAFEESESETEQEAPPTYSPMPKEGEEVCARSPMSEEGAVGGNEEQSQTPVLCTCDRSSIVRTRPRSRSPRHSAFPAVLQPMGPRFPSTSSAAQGFMFDDNFDNTQIANLPKDPPPYIDNTRQNTED